MTEMITNYLFGTSDYNSNVLPSKANPQQAAQFEKALLEADGSGIKILQEPEAAGQGSVAQAQDQLNPMVRSFLSQVENVQMSSRQHFREAFDSIAALEQNGPVDTQTKIKSYLKVQMHMAIASINVTMASKISSSINDGVKTLYRQQA